LEEEGRGHGLDLEGFPLGFDALKESEASTGRDSSGFTSYVEGPYHQPADAIWIESRRNGIGPIR
jgi:hypothetical protein